MYIASKIVSVHITFVEIPSRHLSKRHFEGNSVHTMRRVTLGITLYHIILTYYRDPQKYYLLLVVCYISISVVLQGHSFDIQLMKD